VGWLADPGEMEQVVAEARRQGKRIVFTNGCFDILHRGHVEYLARARSLGDLLIVGLNADDSVRRLKGPGRPVNPLEDRAAVLAALAAVDFVVPFGEDTPAGLIRRLTPDVLVKGGDYRPEEVVGGDWVTAHGGQVVIAEKVPGQSTSGTLRRLQALPPHPDA
jgi:D-beta-D-heptose 7-phosphate kinase / D-beta-D-heptose 1-phosphate adenosyltransferase